MTGIMQVGISATETPRRRDMVQIHATSVSPGRIIISINLHDPGHKMNHSAHAAASVCIRGIRRILRERDAGCVDAENGVEGCSAVGAVGETGASRFMGLDQFIDDERKVVVRLP